MDRSYAKIKVTANGPYEVSNVQDIRLYAIKPDEAGASEEYVPGQKFTADETPFHLCRCGRLRTLFRRDISRWGRPHRRIRQ